MNSPLKIGIHFLTISALCCFGIGIQAQTTYEINTDDSQIWVDGTSTLKNWKAEVQTWEGEFIVNDDGSIGAVKIILDVESMDGGRGPDMNAKIHTALASVEHPKIVFTGVGVEASDGNDLAVEGTLEMAGKSVPVTVVSKGSLDGRITGNQPIKLSSFEIDPPTAMFGTIVTHDDATIGFDLSLVKK